MNCSIFRSRSQKRVWVQLESRRAGCCLSVSLVSLHLLILPSLSISRNPFVDSHSFERCKYLAIWKDDWLVRLVSVLTPSSHFPLLRSLCWSCLNVTTSVYEVHGIVDFDTLACDSVSCFSLHAHSLHGGSQGFRQNSCFLLVVASCHPDNEMRVGSLNLA